MADHGTRDFDELLVDMQLSIETLLHWCIFHQKKAEEIVQTWEKQFHSSRNEQKIPLLYLANDILLRSMHEQTELLVEFWKVLPAALKDVIEKGDDRGKNEVSKLIDLWEEKEVFGSHAGGLNDLMLGTEPPPALQLDRNCSRPVRVVRRDDHSIDTNLPIGGMAEKILSAFQLVLVEQPDEDMEFKNYMAVVNSVGMMEKEVKIPRTPEGEALRVKLAGQAHEQEIILKQSIERLKTFETNRAALVSQLTEALDEQEFEREILHTHLQVAEEHVQRAINLHWYFSNPINPPSPTAPPQTDSNDPTAETSDQSRC